MTSANQVLELNYSTYPDRLESGLFHFKANGPLACEGFGSDFDEPKALIKAATECAERHCMRTLTSSPGATSSGFAGHSSAKEARTRAGLELIERDSFLVGWLSGHNPQWLESSEIEKHPKAFHLIDRMSVHGFAVQIGIVSMAESIVTAVGAIRPKTSSQLEFGVVLGCASSKGLEGAIASVIMELARAATVLLNRASVSPILFADLPRSSVRDGKTTFEFYLDPKNLGQELRNYLAMSRAPLVLPVLKFEIEEFQRRINGPRLDLTIARASSLEAQQLFFGEPSIEKINPTRFQQLALNVTNFEVMPLP